MKIFTGEQIKLIDKYTIENEPVSSPDLMERAAGKLFSWIAGRYSRSDRFFIFAGPGNNGGDGLALAAILSSHGYKAEVFYISFTEHESDDWKIKRRRLEDYKDVPFHTVTDPVQFPVTTGGNIIVDAIFGSGLNRPADGLAGEIIKLINRSESTVLSIDIPSGLFSEDNSRNNPDAIVEADHTLSFQFPKLAFMFADNHRFTGEWHLLDIGLHLDAINNTFTPYSLLEESDISRMLKKRGRFDHKGCFGHGLLIAGSGNKTGAAILAAKGALKSGIGLLTCHLPEKRVNAFISVVPETMVQSDIDGELITSVTGYNEFSAVAAGPGIGTSEKTASVIKALLLNCYRPLVLDADALNIIALNREFLEMIPSGTILTPHPREFERIAGEAGDGYTRLKMQRNFSAEHQCIVVLKGAYTSVTMPDGRVYFNSTGNPGMATAGSGDVLTGIILSLLSQGYMPGDAAIAGVFLHGLAGDIGSELNSMEALTAGDIAGCLGKAFRKIRGNNGYSADRNN